MNINLFFWSSINKHYLKVIKENHDILANKQKKEKNSLFSYLQYQLLANKTYSSKVNIDYTFCKKRGLLMTHTFTIPKILCQYLSIHIRTAVSQVHEEVVEVSHAITFDVVFGENSSEYTLVFRVVEEKQRIVVSSDSCVLCTYPCYENVLQVDQR